MIAQFSHIIDIVINFGEMTEEEARRWPALMRSLREGQARATETKSSEILPKTMVAVLAKQRHELCGASRSMNGSLIAIAEWATLCAFLPASESVY